MSVIVPTHNRSILLSGALDSVWAQTYRPIELIVVDDGSTDKTGVAVEAWQSAHCGDDRFTLKYVAQENRGPAVARNCGLALARGEYIQFLDSDDRLHPGKLAIQSSMLDNASHLDAVVGQAAFLDKSGNVSFVTNIRGGGQESLPCVLCKHDVAPPHLVLHRRESLIAIQGFDETLVHSEDIDILFRMALAGAQFAFMPDVVAFVPHNMDKERVSLRLREAGPTFERQFYLRILTFGMSWGSATSEFRQALSERLVSIAKRYYGGWRPQAARMCLETAREICPQFCPGLARLYLGPAGSALGIGIEFARRALKWAGRRVRRVRRWIDA